MFRKFSSISFFVAHSIVGLSIPGVIAKYNNSKEYGFIREDSTGKIYFFIFRNLKNILNPKENEPTD